MKEEQTERLLPPPEVLGIEDLSWRERLAWSWRRPAAFFAKGIVSLFTAAPLAVQTFAAFAGKQPKEFSRKWFNQLSGSRKAVSIIALIFSLGINTSVNYKTIPSAYKKLRKKLKKCLKRPWKNAAILLLGICSAVSAAAIGYASFEWIGKGMAIINGIISFVVMSGTRFFGLLNFRIRKDYQTQLIEKLSLLKKEYLDELNQYIAETNLTPENVMRLLFKMQEIIDAHPDALKSSKYQSYGIVLDAVLATAAAIAIAPVFAENFVRGIKLMGLSNAIKKVDSTLALVFISLPSLALSSATPILYFGQVFNVIKTILSAFGDLKHPALMRNDKIKLGLIYGSLILINVVTSAGVYNLAEDVEDDPENVFRWMLSKSDSTYGTLLPVLGAAGAYGVNLKLVLEQAAPQPEFIHMNTTVNNSLFWLKQNKLTRQMINELQQNELNLMRQNV